MTERDEKFVSSWAHRIESGPLQYFIKTTLITCLFSLIVILFYTWNNIQKGRLLESIAPLSFLIFGLGIPLGLIISGQTWIRNNNRYKFLTKDVEFSRRIEKKKWIGNDKIWDISTGFMGAIFFIMLYAAIFLFDNGEPTPLKYSIVGIILSYFLTQLIYSIYRFIIDRSGGTKKFPFLFKCIFACIILLTIILWIILFSVN